MKTYPSNDPHRYDDMLHLPHYTSPYHPHMSAIHRAAQFSPFAALTGYEDSIHAIEHLRCNRIPLSDEQTQIINTKLCMLQNHMYITVFYFHENYGTDGHGGTAAGDYRSISGEVRQLDMVLHTLRIQNSALWVDLKFEDIYDILYSQDNL